MPAGTNVASGVLVSPGGQQGIPGPNAVSADAGNQATFGSDSRIYVPDPSPVIWSQTRRVFNSIGNPNFEVNQRSPNIVLTNPANFSFPLDRWYMVKAGSLTGQFNCQQLMGKVLIPGTSYQISQSYLSVGVVAQQASMAASDYFLIGQPVEGPNLRELLSDTHSISVLVRSTVANLTFSIALVALGNAYSLVKSCTLGAAGQWTLITIPSLPVWTASGTWSTLPGNPVYSLYICLAAGSTYLSSTQSSWLSGAVFGVTGQSNYLASPVNSTFDIAFVQHEPGPLCTTLIDKPFSQNLDECLRYYCKSSPYSTPPVNGTTKVIGNIVNSNATVRGTFRFPKIMAKTPTIRTCGTTVTLNQVYLEATSANVNVASYSADDSNLVSLQLSAAAPAAPSNSISILAGLDADTGW